MHVIQMHGSPTLDASPRQCGRWAPRPHLFRMVQQYRTIYSTTRDSTGVRCTAVQ